jgi:hypothetical protein
VAADLATWGQIQLARVSLAAAVPTVSEWGIIDDRRFPCLKRLVLYAKEITALT